MLIMTKPGFAATALVSLSLALPLTVQSARADCLSDVETYRSMLEQGRLETLDLDREKEGDRLAADPADAPLAGAGDEKAASADASAEGTVSVQTKTGTVAVPAGKRKPRESWVGNPAAGKSVTDHSDDTGSSAEGEAALEGEVAVQTDTSTVTVPVGDGEPRESWFGNPPNLKTVGDYLDGAEIAAKKGDEAACMEQLNDARTAVTASVD